MQESSIQYQHFWVELLLGIAVIAVIAMNPLAKGIVSLLVFWFAMLTSRTILKGRMANARWIALRRQHDAEKARRDEALRIKQEALHLAQRESAMKYLDVTS